MNSVLTQSVVRILRKNGMTAGTGFFIAENGLIATCAHVVADYTQNEEISIEVFSTQSNYRAKIEWKWWRKPSEEDIAILRLMDAPNDEVPTISLGYPWNINNSSLLTFGFPASKPIEGLNGKCEVIGRTTENGCSVLQLRSPEVTRGFSGAPVMNPATDKIVGMISAISKPDQYGRQAETTFITPSDILSSICPEIERTNLKAIKDRLKSKKVLCDLFVDLSSQSLRSEEPEKELSVVDQLGLDPIFDVLEVTANDGFKHKERISAEIKDLQSFSGDVVEEISKIPRCVVLGEAGAGKTTVLEKVVLNTTEKLLSGKEAPLPVYIELPTWPTSQSFLDFVCSQWPFASSPFSSLENGSVALYLDGLNELGAGANAKMDQLREWLSVGSSSRRATITSRMNDYFLSGIDLNIPIVKIEGMNESIIRAFSKKYLDGIGRSSEEFLSQVFEQSQDVKGSSLLKLASNPFLLTALIVSYAKSSGSGSALPKNKGLICKRLIEGLYRREKERNWSIWFPYNEIEPKLAELAFYMIDSDNSVEIPEADALEYCSAEVIAMARSAGIVRIKDKKISFYHQLMQEFFAAVKIKKAGLSQRIEKPQIKEGQRRDSRWDQAIVSLCGISESPDDVVLSVLEARDPYLASICIASGIKVSSTTIEKTINQLIEGIAVWDWLDSEKRSEVTIQSLSDIGSPAVPFLLKFIESKEVVLVDREGLTKDTLVMVGGTVLLVAGAAAALAIAPQTGFRSLLGVVPLAKKISENEHFSTAARSLWKNQAAKSALHQVVGSVPQTIQGIEIEIDPIRKIRLLKLIISALGNIGDSGAKSALQKLSVGDPDIGVRTAAECAIAKIEKA